MIYNNDIDMKNEQIYNRYDQFGKKAYNMQEL